MKQKQYILHSWVIEVIAVLLASMIAFQVCNIFGIRMNLLPFIMATGYVILKFMYHLCITVARYIIEAIPQSFGYQSRKEAIKAIGFSSFSYLQTAKKFRKNEWNYFTMNTSVSNNNTNSKKRRDDEKLNAILKYTRDTFKRFDLDELRFSKYVNVFAILWPIGESFL